MRQKKRRCEDSQAAVNSYLSQTYTNGEYSVHDQCQPFSIVPSISSSPLPPSIQSSLLNVGMRVRKAIPEGYKNKSANEILASAEIVSPQKANHHSEKISTPKSGLKAVQVYSPISPPWSISAHRELTPFCGIPKVGDPDQRWGKEGLSTTEQNKVGSEILIEEIDDSDEPFLCSQVSTISSSSVYSATDSRKRRSEDEMHSPIFSYNRYSHATQTELKNRIFVTPKIKRKLEKEICSDQNLKLDDDFDDADFLDYGVLAENEIDMMNT